MTANDNRQILDEAYERLHRTGPEYEEWLSNHAPMAVEALAHHGHPDSIHRWIDAYQHRLEQPPRPGDRITADNWSDALGDPRRLGDWPLWFTEQLAEADWTQVLSTWWPRLLPGVTASATHCVIRVGHAVRTLRDHGANRQRLAELAQALGYWAARWESVEGVTAPGGTLDAASALAAIPRITQQDGGITGRLAQLAELPGWRSGQAAIAPMADVDDAPLFLRQVVTAAVTRYLTHGHGDGVMQVHAATAPNAVLRVLPSLPKEQWADSAAVAWTASAAVQAAYAPAAAAPVASLPTASGDVAEVFQAAVANGDAHVIKFTDTAGDVFEWTGDRRALAASLRSAQLVSG